MSQKSASFSDRIKSYPLYFLPHHAISRVVYKLTRLETQVAQPVIHWFIKQFDVDMSDAKTPDIKQFKSFNAFFTRSLKCDVRPIATKEGDVASPVDGRVSQAGNITTGRIFQAKGQDYSLEELLGGRSELTDKLQNGHFSTLYLSPSDYHRIHMPLAGTLISQIYIPGRLFSVAPHTVRTVPRLFARNERVVALFQTAQGPMAMVLVGAINVAAIETVWSGLVTPPKGKSIVSQTYLKEEQATLEAGDEMGRFNMGSTVILILGEEVRWIPELLEGKKIRMGEKIGFVQQPTSQFTTRYEGHEEI